MELVRAAHLLIRYSTGYSTWHISELSMFHNSGRVFGDYKRLKSSERERAICSCDEWHGIGNYIRILEPTPSARLVNGLGLTVGPRELSQ